MSLSETDLLAYLDEEGPLKASFPSLESRPEQAGMLKDVIRAFNHNKIALIEAGTGCGKSMAYLIPALLFASKTGEKIVISTHTINLQEQLLDKDIPRLLKGLKVNLKVVLVKGMHNYLCLRKFHEACETRLTSSPEEIQVLEKISDQLNTLTEGSKSELNVLPSFDTWDKINAESDTCTGTKCPYYKDCFFIGARKQVQDAQILIVNHHLLFADLAIRSDKNLTPLLPPYERLIIDEAHHIEDVATEHFSKKVNRLSLLKTIGRLLNEGSTGKIGLLNERLTRLGVGREFFDRITLDLPGQKKALLKALNEMYDAFYRLINKEGSQRLMSGHQSLPLFKNEIHPKAHAFVNELRRVHQMIRALIEDLEALKDDRLNETTAQIRHDMKALSGRLNEAADTLNAMMAADIPENEVRWISHSQKGDRLNTTLINAYLDLSELFVQNLFSKFRTVLLSSATLTADKKFDYFETRFGLKLPDVEHKVEKSLYPSPFDYSRQAALGLPDDLPDPNSPEFIEAASDMILKLVEVTKGGAFVLFTSYSMLREVYNRLEGELKKRRLIPMKQGDLSRKDLVKNFKESRYSVLFGTDSFWEGVDVAGEKLRLVVIVKLPFKVPTEPLIEARVEKIKADGQEPFKAYSLPQAILKLKQGFGRLIRGKKDKGAIVILDPRILKKNYGKAFLSSLPQCVEAKGSKEEVIRQLRQFYG